jgi:hypothetical protein
MRPASTHLLEQLTHWFARECEFRLPYVMGQAQDPRTPGLVAVWVGDRVEEGRHLGVVVNLDERAILCEFDSFECEPGELPPEGIAGFLLAGPVLLEN